MLHFIDIHAHHPSNDEWAITILNVQTGFNLISGKGPFSAGIHPWFLNADSVEEEFRLLESAASKVNVLAIGECGLDRACDTDFELQKRWFERQIDLAISRNKPLVVHCVRAYEEILEILSRKKACLPVIFHGFNKKIEVAEKIIRSGHFLSFGKHLQEPATRNVFSNLPSDRLFLETDASDISIAEVYRFAAEAKAVSTSVLQEQIAANFTSVFGPAVLK